MQQLLQILVAGGDRRQQYAAQKLAKSPQLSVTTIGFSQSDSETLPEFDVLILPIHTTAESVPSKNGNLSLPELLSHVKKGGAAAYSPKLFAGCVKNKNCVFAIIFSGRNSVWQMPFQL